MEASELRIGNLIFENSRVETVDDICNGYINPYLYDGIEPNYAVQEPIPLTEEWLLKFGFVKQRNHFLRLNLNGVFEEGDYLETFDCENFTFGYYGGLVVKHVHQLQNLYFALTGEELKQI